MNLADTDYEKIGEIDSMFVLWTFKCEGRDFLEVRMCAHVCPTAVYFAAQVACFSKDNKEIGNWTFCVADTD